MMQIPIWLMVLLVMWCISYIVLVIRFFTVYERELSEMRMEYTKMHEETCEEILKNKRSILQSSETTSDILKQMIDNSDYMLRRFGEDEREILKLEDRLKSLEGGFELLRNERYTHIDVSEGAEVWAISDGALHRILDTDGNSENRSEESDENSGEGTDETE